MLLIVMLVLGTIGGLAFSTLVLIKLGLLAAYVPLMILYTRKNWPRRLDPKAIPNDLLREA